MAIVTRSGLYLSMNDLADAQTTAYGGGWRSSVAKLTEICRVQSIDLALSLAAFDRTQPIALVLIGRRANQGWLHDIAVAPSHRRSGIGTRLMRTALQEMHRAGVDEVELDVAAMRSDAIGLYQRLGFERTRSYHNLAASGETLQLHATTLPPECRIEAGTESQLIAAYAQTIGTEPLPCWDRSLASLLAYPDGYISRLMQGDQELALMHYLARPAEGNDPERLRPLFVHLAPGQPASTLIQLLGATAGAAFGDASRVAIRVALEPESSTLAKMVRAIGMPLIAESYDMRLRFSSANLPLQ